MKRICIRNATHAVEWPDTPEGMRDLLAFRRSRPEFKRRKIRRVLQLAPMEVGVPYEWFWAGKP